MSDKAKKPTKAEQKNAQPLGTGGISCLVVETSLDLFVDRLMRKATDAPEQKLEAREIVEFARSLKDQKHAGIIGPVQTLINNWLTHHEADLKKQSRYQPYERIIVERFAALFPPGESLQGALGVSRRILPPLFKQLRTMGGDKLIDQCQAAAQKIFQQVRTEYGPEFRWKHFYQNMEVNALVDELLVVIAWRFQDFDTEFASFVKAVNGNLAPPEAYAYEGPGVETWQLTEAKALSVLWLLFEPYTHKLADKDEREVLTKQFGDKAQTSLQQIIDNIQKRLEKAD